MKDALWYAATIVNHPIGLINNARQTHLAWIGIGSAVSFSSRAVITHRTRIGRIIVAGFAPLFGRINDNSIPRRWSRDSWKELIERIFYNFYNYDEILKTRGIDGTTAQVYPKFLQRRFDSKILKFPESFTQLFREEASA